MLVLLRVSVSRSSSLLVRKWSAAVLLCRRAVLMRRHRRVTLGAFFVLKAQVFALGIVFRRVFYVLIMLFHSLVVSQARLLGKR